MTRNSATSSIRPTIKFGSNQISRVLLLVKFKIHLSEIYAEIHGVGLIPITETPHFEYLRYKFFCDDSVSSTYAIYLKNYHNDSSIDEQIARFHETVEFVRNSDDLRIQVSISKDKKIVIVDGVHRAAAAALFKKIDVTCYLGY